MDYMIEQYKNDSGERRFEICHLDGTTIAGGFESSEEAEDFLEHFALNQ